MTRSAKSNYYKDCLSNNLKNPKQFWNTIKSITNTLGICPINQIRGGSTIIHDAPSIAKVFEKHFSTVCSDLLPNSSYNDLYTPAPCHSSSSFSKITPTDVLIAIEQISPSSGAGLDEIEPKYFKIASQVLMYPLADLFNMSLSTCELPSTWKSSRITPIFKGGDNLDQNDYRPISIISTIAKVFEKLVFNQLSHYLMTNNIISPLQSGFQSNHSTTTALLKFTNDIYSASDSGNITGAIFIDLKKALTITYCWTNFAQLVSPKMPSYGSILTYIIENSASLFRGINQSFLLNKEASLKAQLWVHLFFLFL